MQLFLFVILLIYQVQIRPTIKDSTHCPTLSLSQFISYAEVSNTTTVKYPKRDIYTVRPVADPETLERGGQET